MGKFDKYKIDLKGMQTDTLQLEFLLDNIFFANIDGQEVQRGKVNVTVSVKKTTHVFELRFHAEGNVIVQCDRCLDDMEWPVLTDDKLLVKLGATYGEEGDNLIVVPESDGYINVAWLMYEFVSLAVPMKHIHSPGKCNKGMTTKLNKHLRSNANDADDDSINSDFDDSDDISVDVDEEAQIDPRWEDLKKILDNN